jgi:hypothetical protein
MLDDIEGDPDIEDEPIESDLSTRETISQLFLDGEDREDDDEGEPSLAVPEIPHWQSQERIWRYAGRSRLRDEELEPNLSLPDTHFQDARTCSVDPARDELEMDLDLDEADELDAGEPDPGWNESVNQEHIGKNYSWVTDGEMSLATTESNDQRFAAFSGSRTDREADPFPYDPPRHPDQPLDYPMDAAAKVEAELRKHRRDDPMDKPKSWSSPDGASQAVCISLWLVTHLRRRGWRGDAFRSWPS